MKDNNGGALILPEIIVRLYGGLKTPVKLESGPKGQDEKGIRVFFERLPTLRDVLSRLRIPEENVHLAFADKKRVGMPDEITNGVTLHIFPPMAGG